MEEEQEETPVKAPKEPEPPQHALDRLGQEFQNQGESLVVSDPQPQGQQGISGLSPDQGAMLSQYLTAALKPENLQNIINSCMQQISLEGAAQSHPNNPGTALGGLKNA